MVRCRLLSWDLVLEASGGSLMKGEKRTEQRKLGALREWKKTLDLPLPSKTRIGLRKEE